MIICLSTNLIQVFENKIIKKIYAIKTTGEGFIRIYKFNFFRIFFGIASLCTIIDIVLYFTNGFDAKK